MQYGIEYGLSTRDIEIGASSAKDDFESLECAKNLDEQDLSGAKWKRRSEAEIAEIRKRLRRTSFSLTVPILRSADNSTAHFILPFRMVIDFSIRDA